MKHLLAAICLVALAACVAPPGPGSTNLIDGSYQGRATRLVANGPACPDSQWGTVELAGQTLDFGFSPGLSLEAAVQPDGSLHAENGKTVLDGRLTGEHLEFTVTSPDCQSRFAGNFIWNHS